jgi:hypothetical protein
MSETTKFIEQMATEVPEKLNLSRRLKPLKSTVVKVSYLLKLNRLVKRSLSLNSRLMQFKLS